jgi:hypothetical protein
MSAFDNIGPKLSGIKKDNPFGVPDGYFENFGDNLRNKISSQQKTPARDTVFLTWKPYLAAAAVLLIIALAAGRYFLGESQYRKAEKRFHAEVSQVVEQELYSISEETILEVYQSDLNNEREAAGFSSDEAIDYLMNETLDEEELLNTL